MSFLLSKWALTTYTLALGIVVGLLIPINFSGPKRWDLEVTGKVLLTEQSCAQKGFSGSCAEVWWLNSKGEEAYRTWSTDSECYLNTRAGFDLNDACRE